MERAPKYIKRKKSKWRTVCMKFIETYIFIYKINYFKMELWGQKLYEFKILINVKLPSLYVRPIFRFTNSAGTYFSNSDYSQTI